MGAFDRIYAICRKKVRFKRLIEREDVMPFKTGNGIHPEWWNFYNSLKHDLGLNIEKATLKNARDALAGAFMLNVCHIPGSIRLCKYGVLRFGSGIDPDSSGQQDRLPCHVWQEILEKKQPYPAFVETPIFIYSYDQP